MRPRDPRIALSDVVRAGELIEQFVRGVEFSDYESDAMLSSAVERQFEIVGEAIARALRADESLATRLTDAPAVIGFRNVLAHGYDRVSNALVWSLAHERLPALLMEVRAVLGE